MKIVKSVDGFRVRNTIDVDFSVIGDHNLYPYIGRGEIWFDRAFIKEKDFFIKLFKERSVLTKKYGYEKAKEMLRTRVKSNLGLCPSLRSSVRPSSRLGMTERLGMTKQFGVTKTAKLYLVDGAMARKTLDPNFCFGGHWKIYKYIPKNEVWIDSAVLPGERKYVIIHEMHELKLMKKGMNYNNAHDFASALEKAARRNDGVGHYLKD